MRGAYRGTYLPAPALRGIPALVPAAVFPILRAPVSAPALRGIPALVPAAVFPILRAPASAPALRGVLALVPAAVFPILRAPAPAPALRLVLAVVIGLPSRAWRGRHSVVAAALEARKGFTVAHHRDMGQRPPPVPAWQRSRMGTLDQALVPQGMRTQSI